MSDRELCFGFAPVGSYSIENKQSGRPMAVFKPKVRKWDELQKIFEKITSSVEKARVPNVSWCKYKKEVVGRPYGQWGKEGHQKFVRRSNKNVEWIDCIWIDIDKELEEELTFEELRGRLDMLGWNYALYTTWSYDGKNNKFRVVLPLSESIRVGELEAVVSGAAVGLGLGANEWDRASLVPSQLMYLPSATPGRLSLGVPKSVFVYDGEHINVEEVKVVGSGLLAGGNSRSGGNGGSPDGLGGDSDGSVNGSGGSGESSMTKLQPSEVGVGDRHTYLKKWLVRMMKEGVDQEDIERRVAALNALFDTPLGDVEVRGILIRVRESIVEGEGGLGLFALREILERLEEENDDAFRKQELEKLVKRIGLSLAEQLLSVREMRALGTGLGKKCRLVMKPDVFKTFAEQHYKNYVAAGHGPFGSAGDSSGGEGGEEEGGFNPDDVTDEEMFGDVTLFDRIVGSSGDGSVNGSRRGRELLDRFKEDVAGLCSRYVFVNNGEKIWDKESRCSITQGTFEKKECPGVFDRVLEMDAKYYGLFTTANGTFRGVPKDFVLREQLIDEVSDLGYKPGDLELYQGVDNLPKFNIWEPLKFKGARGGGGTRGGKRMSARVRGFIGWLKKAMDRRDFEIMLDILAWIVQRPDQRLYWFPIVCGTNGTGKSLLVSELMKKLVGVQNVCSFTTEEFAINTGFNSKFANHQIAVCHEVDSSGVRDFAMKWESLKGDMTSDQVSFMRKGQEAFMGHNVITRLGASNAATPFSISRNERRVVFLTLRGVTEDVVGLEEYRDSSLAGSTDRLGYQMSGVYSWMQDSENIESLVGWLGVRRLQRSRTFYVNAPVNIRTAEVKGVDDFMNSLVDELMVTGIAGQEGLTLLDNRGTAFIQEKTLIEFVHQCLNIMVLPEAFKLKVADGLNAYHGSKMRRQFRSTLEERGWTFKSNLKTVSEDGAHKTRRSILFYKRDDLFSHTITEEVWEQEARRYKELLGKLGVSCDDDLDL